MTERPVDLSKFPSYGAARRSLFSARRFALMASVVAGLGAAVYGFSPTDVFAVGNDGIVLRYDGIGWSENATLNTIALRGLWGSSPLNILAVGTGAPGQPNAFRYNGTSWHSESIGTVSGLEAVYGVSANDIFTVGIGGRHNNQRYDAFFNFDGTVWTRSEASTFGEYTDVWAPSGTTVYVIGVGPLVYRGIKG